MTHVLELLTGLLLLLVVVAFLIELVLLAIRPIIQRFIVWNGMSELVIGLTLGVLAALWVDLDAFAILFRQDDTVLGTILTGLIIGRGSTWLLTVLPGITPHSVSPGRETELKPRKVDQ